MKMAEKKLEKQNSFLLFCLRFDIMKIPLLYHKKDRRKRVVFIFVNFF